MIFTARARIQRPAGELQAWLGRPGVAQRLAAPFDGLEKLLRRCEFHVRQEGPESCVLEERVEYVASPLALLAGRSLKRRLDRAFAYRHAVIEADLARHASVARGGTLRVAVTGASGLVGSALVPFLTAGGHRVLRLVRRKPAGEGEAFWEPETGAMDIRILEGCDAVVHLAGESIASGRWSAERKSRILRSRERGTRLMSEALAALSKPPRVLVCASAIGYYGDHGEAAVDETAAPGRGFLAEVCQAWEAATAPARAKGIRVANLRIGVVLSPAGGALAKMLTPFRFGAGGPVGSGRQFMSWISIDDLLGAIHLILTKDSLYGPVNAVAPGAVSNAEFARVLGAVLGRPALLPLPGPAVSLLFGEMGKELLLAGARARPRKLLEAGFQFLHPDLDSALRHVLGR